MFVFIGKRTQKGGEEIGEEAVEAKKNGLFCFHIFNQKTFF